MALIFYPHEDELESSTVQQRLEVLLEAAGRFKAVILDQASKEAVAATTQSGVPRKLGTPRDIAHAFNWTEIARLLQEIRELPESNPTYKIVKAERLTKLAEVYEVLRGAKMTKLEAVRLALVNEAKQLQAGNGNATQVA